MYVIKKDGRRQEFDANKIKVAVNKSAERVLVKISGYAHKELALNIAKTIETDYDGVIHVNDLHNLVEYEVGQINPTVADSYRNYRNFRKVLAQ